GYARTMYDAVCANCGAETQVPFQPRQDRPVYCSDCFAKVKPSRPSW
ncbi:MAG: CxxC-x17-CxxC domain-containing protein, partial [Dehalococcoidia bacterium]